LLGDLAQLIRSDIAVFPSRVLAAALPATTAPATPARLLAPLAVVIRWLFVPAVLGRLGISLRLSSPAPPSAAPALAGLAVLIRLPGLAAILGGFGISLALAAALALPPGVGLAFASAIPPGPVLFVPGPPPTALPRRIRVRHFVRVPFVAAVAPARGSGLRPAAARTRRIRSRGIGAVAQFARQLRL
jgi:hypothetical protein